MSITKNELPNYVKLNKTALRLRGDEYFRDAGVWSVGYKIIDGELFSWSPQDKWLHRVSLIKISKEEWEKDNYGYV